MGSYTIDSHNIQRVVSKEGFVTNEGDTEVPAKPYQIPYRILVPKHQEVQNLLVPVWRFRQPHRVRNSSDGTSIHDYGAGGGDCRQAGNRQSLKRSRTSTRGNWRSGSRNSGQYWNSCPRARRPSSCFFISRFGRSPRPLRHADPSLHPGGCLNVGYTNPEWQGHNFV